MVRETKSLGRKPHGASARLWWFKMPIRKSTSCRSDGIPLCLASLANALEALWVTAYFNSLSQARANATAALVGA